MPRVAQKQYSTASLKDERIEVKLKIITEFQPARIEEETLIEPNTKSKNQRRKFWKEKSWSWSRTLLLPTEIGQKTCRSNSDSNQETVSQNSFWVVIEGINQQFSRV